MTGDMDDVRAEDGAVQMIRERRDGPRYVEAIRGARAMRWRAVCRIFGVDWWLGPHAALPHKNAASQSEHQRGLPEGWITR